MPYVIKDWDARFENAQSRKVDQLQWVPLPNKHDGKGFRRIAAMAKRCEIFSGWVLIVELASKMPVRGVVADADGDLTCTDMAIKTGFPESCFQVAIEALKDPLIGWLVYRGPPTGSALPERSHSATTPLHSSGAEGNGTEGNGMEQKNAPAAPPASKPSPTKPRGTAPRAHWKLFLAAFCEKIGKEKSLGRPYSPTGREIGQLREVYDKFGPENVVACWEMAWEKDRPWSEWGYKNGRAISWFCDTKTLMTIMDDHRYKAKAERIRMAWGSDAGAALAGLVKTSL